MPASACSRVPFFAVTTHGLEDVSAAEISSLDEVRPTAFGYGRIEGSCEVFPETLLSARTVNDVYLHLRIWSGIARQRSTLRRLTSLSGGLDLDYAARIVSSVRRLPETARFSVTASCVGRLNYTTKEMKLAVAEGVADNALNLCTSTTTGWRTSTCACSSSTRRRGWGYGWPGILSAGGRTNGPACRAP
jgi:23S rRNA G2445 N2-methylase RlmL